MSLDSTAISGDSLEPAAFAERYREAYGQLWLIATGITGDRTYAEDILQEAAVVGLQKLDQFQPGTNLVAWMASIVRHCALNYARKTRNRGTVPMDPHSMDSVVPVTQGATASLNTVMAESGQLREFQTEFDDDIVRGLKAVSDVARCCVLLRVVASMSYTEISELMKIPEGTAMSHVHRAKRSIRQTLSQGETNTSHLREKGGD